MAANEEGKNTPQNDPFKNLLEGDTKKPKNIDLQKVDILSGTPTLATPNITNILPGSSLYSLELSKVYPRSLQRYASELKPDQWQLGTDWEQSMAKNQSTATKFGRGAKNLGRTFYATALETVAGSFTAGPNAWNSPFWRDLDESRQKAKEESPIYKPEGYDDMGFFKAAGTAAFWADEFQEGIGFFTGAMAGSMLLTGPIRGAAKTLANPNLVKGVARGSRLNFFRGLAKGGVKGADDVYNGISRSIFLKEGLKNIAKQAKTSLGKSNLMMTSLFAARSEAAVEARDTVKSTYSTLQNRYVKDNNLSDISQIPGIVKSQLYNTAIGLGNSAFTNNLALLTLTNMTTFKLLGIGGNVGSRAIGSSMVGRYLNTPVKGGITRLQKVTGLGARGAKNVRSAGRLGQGMFVESIGQEYPQYVIQDASINYAVDKHFEGNTQSLSEHYLDSASNAFSDPHGQKAIALGALISAFAMGGGRVASKVSKKYSTQGQKIDANIEELLELADAGKFNERMQQTQNMNVVEKNMLEAQTLWEQGENKLAQNARDRAVAAHVSQLMQFEGGVNNMTATLDEIEQDLTDEQFAEMVGQPVESLRDETGKIPMKTRQEYTGNLKEKVKTLSNIYKDIQVAFPEITTPTRLQYARADETQTEEYQQEVLVQKYLKEQLYYTLAGSHLSDKAGEELLDAMEDSSGVNKDTLQTELDKILEGLDVGLTSEGLPGQPADPAAFKKAMEAVNEQLNKLVTSNKNVNRRDRKGRFTATPDTFLELAADYMMHRLNANHAVELYNELVGDSKNNRQKLRAEAAEEVKKAEEAENLSNQQVIERKLKEAVTPADLDGVKGGVRTKAGRAVSRRRKELTRQQKDLYRQFDKSSAPEELLEQLKKNRSDQKQAEIEAAYHYWSSSKNRAAAAENKNNPPQVAPDGKPIKPTTITPAAPQGSTSANSLVQQAREAATKNAGKKGKKGKTITLQALTPEQKAEQDRLKNEQTQSTPTAADLIKEINTPEVVPGVSSSGAPKFNATGQEIFDETEKETLAKEQGFTDWKHVLNSLNIQEKKAKGTSITKERFEDLTDEQIINIGSKSKSATKVREAKVKAKEAEKNVVQKGLDKRVTKNKEALAKATTVEEKGKIIASYKNNKNSAKNKGVEVNKEDAAEFERVEKELETEGYTINSIKIGSVIEVGKQIDVQTKVEETRDDAKGVSKDFVKRVVISVIKPEILLNGEQVQKAEVRTEIVLKTVAELEAEIKSKQSRNTALEKIGQEGDNSIIESIEKRIAEIKKQPQPTSKVEDDAPIIATPPIDGTIETGRGQYEFVDRNDIDEGIVFIDNGDGTYSPKPFFEHPIPVRYERLSDPSLTVGATVEVVLDEGVNFFDLNRKAFKESELKDWQFSPMYLVKDGERIGLLQMDVVFEGNGKTKKIKTSGKNPIRQQIYKNLASRNKVTLQITDKKFNKGNILNAKTKDGKRIESKLTDVFSNTFTINNLGIAEATENAPIPLIFTESDTGVVKFRKLVPENSPSEMTKNHIAKVNEALDSISAVASAGVVYTAVVTPNGEVTVIPLSTAFLNEKAVEEVIELIKTNKHSEISNIVGLQVAGETFNPKNFKEGDIKEYLLFEPQADNTVKDTIYRFRFPFSELENGQVVKMFGRQMINMLKSNKFSYIIETPSYNNAYDSIDYNPEADPNTVEDAKEIEDFKNRFEDLLRNKRFQVPKETANRPEQFNKFTQESIGLNPSKNVTEDSADTILTTNVYNNNGSLFYDVTLTLGNPTVENKQKEKKVKKKIKPSVSTGSKTAPAKNPNNIEGLGTTPKDDRGDIFGAQKQAEQQPKETSEVEAKIEAEIKTIKFKNTQSTNNKGQVSGVKGYYSKNFNENSAFGFGQLTNTREELVNKIRNAYTPKDEDTSVLEAEIKELEYILQATDVTPAEKQKAKNRLPIAKKELAEIKQPTQTSEVILGEKGELVLKRNNKTNEDIIELIDGSRLIRGIDSKGEVYFEAEGNLSELEFLGFDSNKFTFDENKIALVINELSNKELLKPTQQNIAERFDKTDEAIAYLETTFGKEAIQVADRLANIGGLIPYAYFKNGLIHMSAGNNIDQAYHEAFHLVFNLFFDESTKKKLLAEAKSKSEATTDLAAEEFLAEVYRQVKAADTSKFGGEIVDNEMLSLVDFNNKLSEGDLTIETAMSLIEKLQLKEGELPKLQRSIDKYKPGKDNPLFFHMEGFGVNAQKMVVETIATQFMDLAESRTETDGLLNKSDEDSIPVWWLRHSFRDKEGNPLEADVAMELADAIQNKDKEKGAEILKNNPEIDPTNFLSLPDRDDSGNVFQFENDAATKQKLSSIFYQVYKNWDTKIEKETDNVVQQGWVEALKNRMATQALRIKAVEDLIDTQDLEDQDNQLLTKIYDKPQVETDPMLEGTAALRPIFNNFKRLDPNFLGYRTIIAPQEVMREVQTYLSDTLSFSEGLANMLSAAQFRPEIREIVETIKSLPVATQAKIDYHLRLGYNKFMMVEVTEDGTKFYASNQGSLTKAKLHEWKRSSRKLPNTFVTNYLYDVTIDQETQLHVLSVTDTKAQNIVKQYNEALKGILNERKGGIDPVTASSETISAPIKALSNLIWGMGIKIMDTKNSSEQALQTYINVGVKEFRGDDVYTMQGQELLSELINQNQNGLILLVKKIANVKASGLSLIEEDVTAKTRQIDVFDEHRRLLGEFSKVSKMFNKPKSEAFVAANGNKVFPNNKYTFLGKQVIKLSTDTEYFRDIVDMYMADPAFNPNGTDQLMSLTFKVLTDPQFGETIRANFERTMYDGYKKKFESVAKIDYKNQDEFQSLEVRLHHFVNAGNSKFTRIAIPTQAGRSRNDFIQIPRLNTMKENFGIEYSRADQIRAIIIQDLARIAQAEDFMQKNPESAYDEVYHTQENYRTMSFEFLELPEDDNGENPSHYIEEYLEGVGTDPTGNAAFVEKFIQEAEEKVAEHIAKSEKQVAAYIAKGGITLKNLNPEYLKNLGISNLGQVITQYVEHDLIWQSVEFAKVFANGIYNYKSTNDFYKRMATITTPVYQMSAQGTLPADSNFGMPKEFTKAVLNDVELGMETRDVLQHAADLQTIVSELQSQVKDNLLVTPEKIQSIENSYKTGRDDNNQPIVNKTDATGIISVEFRKSMMQVRDEWTDSHEEAYQNDLKPNGRFIDNNGNVPTLIPQKPFMREASLKDGRVQQFIGKNSFVTLTNELASKTPVLLDIYNRMNAVGTYSSLGKVQLFNMDSAEKASRSGIHTLYAENGTYVQGQLKNIATVTHLSENLGIGQEIRDKAEEKVTINRQFRKGLLSIVIPAEQYSVNGYLKDAKKRLDLSGEQLINLLQAVNVEIASRNFNNFLNKTGLRGVNKGARQKSEDRLQTLKQLKSSFYGQLQDLNNLYVTAMDIVPSTIGGYSYKLPMSYPPIANKMGQLFFSGFSRATHKAKTRGVEAVQVSELGGTERDGELRFLHIEEDEAGNVAVAHAQVDIKRSTAMKMGMTTEEGKFLIAYRVPNQGPSSTIILQVRNFLPESYPKSVRVPGAITTQSGSDFDIDKLFVLFPELDIEGNKIFPNTDTLDRTGYDPRQLSRVFRDKKSFTDAMLSNLIIDLNTAVYTNPVHLIETMEPLDAGLKLIKDILSEVETKLNAEGIELAPELSINSPITPILVEVFNKTGIIGRGLKANALAGLQTAIGSNITVAPSHAPRVRNSEGTVLLLDTVIQRDYTNTQTTGRNISLGLNRAVDSEKTPEQLYKLNEHPFNSTVTSFLESFGVPAPESYMLLQMPAVREVSAEYREKGRGVNSMKDIVLRKLKKYKPKATEATLDQDPIPLEFSEMMNNLIVSKENKSMQGDYLITYYKHFIAADQHRKNNSAITPDTLERVNEPAGLNAYFDSVDYVLDPNNEDRLIFGAENVLEGNSYPLQKEFYENMVKAAELSTNFGYVEFTQSAQKLKQDLRNMLNYDILDVDQHRLIDRAVYTILMSDKQSPFHFMYQRSYVEELLMGDNNISYKLEELKSKYPNLMNNEFFRRLSPHPTNSNLDNKVFPIVFENMEDYNGEIREEIETDSYRLYFEPQEYTDTIDGQNEIRTFMKDVVANAFLSGGFFKSPFSYFDMIHFDVQQAVSEPITLEGGETLNITNFFNLKFEELAKRPDALDQMAHHIIKSVGKFKAGKRRLVPSVSVKGKNIAGGVLKLNVHSGMYSDSKGFPRYVIADIREGKERESRLMRLRGFDSKNSAVYDFANEKSEQFKLLELGIRDATGKMISKSLINEEGQTMDAFMEKNVLKKKRIKTVDQGLDSRKICIRL